MASNDPYDQGGAISGPRGDPADPTGDLVGLDQDAVITAQLGTIYTHEPHPHTLERLEHRDKPVLTNDVLRQKSTKFNAWLAVKITDGVGTMWCAYIFAALALVGLPAALKPGGEGIIAWIAQTFLQLVLLSIIIVGQNIAAASSDQRSVNTFKDAEAILSEAIEIQKHLQAQDEQLIAALKDALSKVPSA